MANLFDLPKFENEEQNIQARLVFLISLGMAGASVIFVIFSVLAMPGLVSRSLSLLAFIAPGIMLVLWLVYKLKVQAASSLLLVLIWLTITGGVITAGSLAAPITIGYMFAITISGLLMTRRINIYITILSLGMAILIAWAEINGWLPNPKPYSPLERLSIYALFFIMMFVLQTITMENIRHLLRNLHSSESKYKSFLESIPTITYINDTSAAANTEYVSPQVEQLLGYSQREFLHDPIFWQKIIHPEDQERVLALNDQTVQTGAPFQVEYRLIAKDGSVVWVHDEAILVHDEDGLPQYWLGVFTDITNRKLAEEEQTELIGIMTKRTIQLQTAAEVSRASSSILDIDKLLPTVVELIRNHFDYYYVGIFLVDENTSWAILRAATGEVGREMLLTGHRLPVADSSMIGWCISHRQARIALDVGVDAVRFRNPYLPLTRSEIALPLITHNEVIGAMTIQSTQPSAFSTVDITALQTMADQLAITIENARLFTERAALISELEERNTELERFTYTVSHDLRSPLVTMRGFLGYLRKDATSGDMARFDSDVTRIARAVDRMQALLNDLLELSRVGRIVNPPQDVPFRQIVDETLELLIGALEAPSVKFHIAEDLPVIRGDRTRLGEIVQNLVSNAIKFMDSQPHPVVEIGTSVVDADGMAILFVRDNGMGIEPEYQERIFGLFNRLNPEIEGTGVGLTLVRRIVEVHGGRIWVDSQPGSGTTFFFTLPVSSS